ncbi:hypothetical protein [Hyalangium rubrum]|uniref:Lipoprotein n=1 Tax=Hyalangium rubrum TaxID=3103134 RepID=A0ABU5H367_9BACT|nr:hypothetical protein [Hyalangium sp. s54d21]MDY7227544.1 hypothetical protein [Hyalangium sp. s54d21]
MSRLATLRWGALGVRLGLLGCLGSSVTAWATEVPREEPPSRWGIGAGVGVGHAYGLLGVQLQVRREQVAGFLTFGMPNVPVVGGGLRWYPSGDRGPVFSLHGTHLLEFEPSDSLTVLSLTVGWRFRWEPGDWKQKGHGIFAEVGAGPSFFWYRGEDGPSKGFGALGPDSEGFPDLALAVGVEW